MRRGLGVLAVLTGVAWVGVLGWLLLAGPGQAARPGMGVVAGLTMLAHLLGGFGGGRRDRTDLPTEPAWVAIAVEKHRRRGATFAAWGLGAAGLAGLLAIPGPIAPARPGWLAILAAGGRLGFHPGLFLAEFWGIMAREKLARSLVGPPDPPPPPVRSHA